MQSKNNRRNSTTIVIKNGKNLSELEFPKIPRLPQHTSDVNTGLAIHTIKQKDTDFDAIYVKHELN